MKQGVHISVILLFTYLTDLNAYNYFTWGRVERFHLYGYGALRFIDEYSDYGNFSSNFSLLEGILDAELDSWFKHPYVFQYHIGLGGYDTVRFSGERRGNTFTGLYNLWFTLFPSGIYTISAYTRRNISYISEKNLPSVRIYDDSYGGGFAFKKREYPDIILRYDTTHNYTDTSESITRRDIRYTTLGASISKPYERSIFSGVYEFRNQNNNISDFSYLEHYFNIYNNSYLTPKVLFSLYLTDITREMRSGSTASGKTTTASATGRLFYRPSSRLYHSFNLSAGNSRGIDTSSDTSSFVYDFEYYLMKSLRTIDSISIQRSYTVSGGTIYNEWRHSANLGFQLIQPYRYAQMRASYFISPSLIDRRGQEMGTTLGNSASFGGSVVAIPIITLSSDATYSTLRSNLPDTGSSEERRIETRLTNRHISRWRIEGVSIYDWKKRNEPLSGIVKNEAFSNTIYIDRYMRRLVASISTGYSVQHASTDGAYSTWFIEMRLSGRLTRRTNATISVQHSESDKEDNFESLWYEQAEVNYVNRLLTIAFQFLGTQRIHKYNLNTFLLTIRRDFNAFF